MSEPYIRPDVRRFLDQLAAMPMTALTRDTIASVRAMSDQGGVRLDADPGEVAVERDLTAPGPAGAIPIRLYDARASRAPGPALVYFHGGGFVVGSIALFEPLAMELARVLDLPVLSVEYRLAPEHPFPAAPDDCEAAARWIASAPAELGSGISSLVLAGDSAGGNLAIVTALALRDRPAAVPVAALLALYPALGRQRDYPSFRQFADGYLLSSEGMQFYDEAYAAEPGDWRGRPADADMAGMPPTIVVTAALDPLRDEGRAFAGQLAAAGVPVVFREAAGNIHGFACFRRVIPSSIGDLAGVLAAFRALINEAEGARAMAAAA